MPRFSRRGSEGPALYETDLEILPRCIWRNLDGLPLFVQTRCMKSPCGAVKNSKALPYATGPVSYTGFHSPHHVDKDRITFHSPKHMNTSGIHKSFPSFRTIRGLLPIACISLGSVTAQSTGFHPSNVGTDGVILVDSHNTYYSGSDGTLFVKVPLPTNATQLQFRVTGGCITDSALRYASADGLYNNSQTPYNFSHTTFGGNYQGVPLGATSGIDPALFAVFFSPSFTGIPNDSENFRSDNGITPDPRKRDANTPDLNQPFYVGDGYDSNNPFTTDSDTYVPPGSIQTFTIPPGATYLLLGIGADIQLNDNQDATGSASAFRVHIFDNSNSASTGIPVSALIAPAVRVSWSSQRNKRYQAQWTADLSQPVWLDFGIPVDGDGLTLSICDETTGVGKRFYRILELP